MQRGFVVVRSSISPIDKSFKLARIRVMINPIRVKKRLSVHPCHVRCSMRFPFLIGAILILFALTNPSEDEYVTWVQKQAAPQSEFGEMLFSLVGSPLIRTSTKRLNLGVVSVYRTAIDDKTGFAAVGFLHNFRPVNIPIKTWVPGSGHPTAAHVVAARDKDRWLPEDGYVWVISPPSAGDLRVRWTPGRASALHANVVAADEEAHWTPADGFAWVVSPPPPGDFRVSRIPVDVTRAECVTVSSKQVSLVGETPVFAGHVECRASKCTPDQRVGAHWTCPEKGTPIGPWEYEFSPEGSRWRLLGGSDWQAF